MREPWGHLLEWQSFRAKGNCRTHIQRTLSSHLPLINALWSQQLVICWGHGWNSFVNTIFTASLEDGKGSTSFTREKHFEFSTPLQFVSADVWTSPIGQIPKLVLCGGFEDEWRGREKRRELAYPVPTMCQEQYFIESSQELRKKNIVSLSFSFFLDEETSAEKWNLCPWASS